MATRPPTRSGAKPGATRQQIERRERFERARRDSLRPAGDGPVVMYGWHTVTAALANPARRLRKLLATENAARRLSDEGVASPIAPELVRPSAIAERLTLTTKAVVRHVSHIYDTLGLEPAAEDHRRVLAVVRYLSA